MARVHSPGYPQFALPKAISSVKRIFDADRRSAIDRGTAVKHIGYSGPSGAADKALATLAHYGLVEKAGKGELKVTQLAVDIIAPDTPQARNAALIEAAFAPQVFADLRERFGTHFSETALESYLLRANFQNIAIRPVIKSYSETCSYLEQEKAFESGGTGNEYGSESNPNEKPETQNMPHSETNFPKTAPPPSPLVMTMLDLSGLNKINMNIAGDKVTLAATLDYRGLSLLEKKIARLKALMEPDEDFDVTGRSEDEDED